MESLRFAFLKAADRVSPLIAPITYEQGRGGDSTDTVAGPIQVAQPLQLSRTAVDTQAFLFVGEIYPQGGIAESIYSAIAMSGYDSLSTWQV